MNLKDLQVLGEVRRLLGKAWLELYGHDKEITGDIFDLRMKINSLEVEVISLMELGKAEESEDI